MEAVFFDLDGTLVDSAGDIRTAANRALIDLGLPARTDSEIRRFIGDGVVKLMERAMGDATGVEAVAAAELFRAHYDACLLETTTFFDGITEMLDQLSPPLSVVSNKPESCCRRILEALGQGRRFRLIAGGDTFPRPKPDPQPLIEMARTLGVDPRAAWVVGDGRQDMRAGRAAGCHTVGVLWGQSDRTSLIEAGADEIVADVPSLVARFR